VSTVHYIRHEKAVEQGAVFTNQEKCMDTGTITVLCVVLAILSGVAGGIAANGRIAGTQGFLLGFFLGPVGVVAALGLDNRPICPWCAGRLDGMGRVC
jgi:hypothetical protein